MNNKLLSLAIAFALSVGFIGCGGGDSSSGGGTSSPQVQLQTGTLSDSKIQGATYVCGTTTGVTDSNGTFTYTSNCSNVKFSIGAVKLGSIATRNINDDATVYPADLLGLDRNETNNRVLVNMLQFLQTFDNDNNPNNGIVIDTNTTTKLNEISEEVNLDSNETDTSVLNSIAERILNKSLIKREYAIAHYEDTLRKDLNISVDTVPPAPALLASKPNPTKDDNTSVIINGEVGAKVFVNGNDINTTIDQNNEAVIYLDTTGDDGRYEFNITLQDDFNKTSDVFIATLIKDATPPDFTIPNSVNVDENEISVIDINATDAHEIIYSINGADSSYFNINATTGVITFKNPADYETKISYDLNITATDIVNNVNTQKLTINVNHKNDIAPIITSTDKFIQEKDLFIMMLESSDADINETQTFTYSITGGVDKALFTLTDDGNLSFTEPLDDQNPKDANKDNIYEVEVKVNDGINDSNSKILKIQITPKNEHAPILTSALTASINENSLETVHTLTYSDADPAVPQNFTFSISGPDSSFFNLDATSGDIVFKNKPDYESKKVYKITAKVNDGVYDSAEQNITISLNHLNDEKPVIASSDTAIINENNTTIMTITSTDADLDQNQTFTYSIDGGADASLFTISDDGVLAFKTAPDYENPTDNGRNNIYEVGVKVFDGANTSETKILNISVLPVNDIAPVLTSQTTLSVNENTTGTVLTLTSSDADLDQNQTFVYSIDGADKDYFNLNSSTGAISFKTPPDYELRQNDYIITAKVTDGVHDSVEQNITISINHLNDEAPQITTVNAKDINENTPTSTVVITAIATDTDIDETQTITYTLAGDDAGLFNLDATNGEITFKNIPDYENPKDANKDNIFNLIIYASDGENIGQASNLTIRLINLDDVPTPSTYSGSVSGIVSNGTPVSNATVVLQDINRNLVDTVTDINGSYSIDLNSSFEGPFIIKSFLPSGEILYSYNDGTKAVTNITPITSLIISNFSIKLNTTMYGLFADFNTLYSNNANFQTLFDTAYSEISDYFNSYLIDMKLSNFNHIYNSFYSSGFDYDKVLSTLDMDVTSDVVIIRHNNNIYSTIPNITLENIEITGRVLDSNSTGLRDATVVAYYGDTVLTATTDSLGRYTFNVPNFASIDLNITYSGISIPYYNVSTFFSSASYSQQIDTVQYPDDANEFSSISGYVYNGRTSGTKIENVSLKIRRGYNNKTGNVLHEIITDDSGNYSINLQNGNYTFEFYKDGWTTEYFNVYINGDNDTYNYYINTFDTNYLAPNALLTAVLTWGDRPRDLDTHLTGPLNADNDRFHAYYSHKIIGTTPSDSLNPCDTNGTIATIDVDDTNGYGPETTSICKTFGHTYHYYIKNFSGSPDFDESNAQVRVKSANGFTKTFNVPYDPSNDNDYWHVFDMDEYGNIIPVNTIISSPSGLN